MNRDLLSAGALCARIAAAAAALIGALALSGCLFPPKIKDFTPQSGTRCDRITFQGSDIYGTLDGLWFKNVLAPDAAIAPPPNSYTPSNIITASVPAGATSGPIRVKFSAAGSIIAAPADFTLSPNFTVEPDPPVPNIRQFGVSASVVKVDSTVTVSWSVANATRVFLGNSLGLPQGTKQFKLTQPGVQTFGLFAVDHNNCFSVAKSVSVTVVGPLKLTVTPNPILVQRGQSVTANATVGGDLLPVQVNCTPTNGLSCAPFGTNSVMSTTTPLTVSAAATAPFGSSSLSVKAAEVPPGTQTSSDALTVVVGHATGPFSEASPTIGTQGTTTQQQTLSNGQCTATIGPGEVPISSANVRFKCGSTSSVSFVFQTSSTPAIGGVTFVGTTTAVVYSLAGSSSGLVVPVNVEVINLPSMTSHTFELSQDNSQTLSFPARVFISQDGSLMLSSGEAIEPNGSIVLRIELDNLTNGTTGMLKDFAPVNGPQSVSASVQTNGSAQSATGTVNGSPLSLPVN